MRYGGAISLLLGGVNYNKIKLLGRWRSNETMMYLHTSARPLVQGFASTMVTHDNNAQIPDNLGAKIDGDGNAGGPRRVSKLLGGGGAGQPPRWPELWSLGVRALM